MTGPDGLPTSRPARDPAAEDTGPETAAALPAGVAEQIRGAVHAEFTPVLHYVADALGRNSAFDELSDRLRTAERRLEARRERPLVVAVHKFLERLRHLDFDPVIKRELGADIVRMLQQAGFEETGQVGEAYDPVRHEALDGKAVNGRARVTEIYSPGLSCHEDVVIRAKVKVLPEQRPQYLAAAVGRDEAAAAASSEE